MTVQETILPAETPVRPAGRSAPAGTWPLPLARAAATPREDVIAVTVLLTATLLLSQRMVMPLERHIRGDWPTFFFPVYAFLGERLRTLDIPGWNPYLFSGTPFAGDPESGWGYLPAMLFYTILPPVPATVAFIAFHIAFAALAVYALARLLGLDAAGSFLAAAAYAFAWVATASGQLVIWSPVSTWMIVALAGVEIAARATFWGSRSRGWLLAGLAISQVIAVWLGQGSVYAMVAIAAWIAYRTLLSPYHPAPWRSRVTSLAINGGGIAVSALGLSAATLLVRLDAVSRSNLAGAVYDQPSAWSDMQLGFSPPELVFELLGGYTGSLWWYVGAIAITLAVMAPLIARRWPPMLYFLLVSVASPILCLDEPTIVHALIRAIFPRFASLHEHAPERILILVAPCVAILGGATISYLPRWRNSRFVLAAIAVAPAACALAVSRATPPYNAVLSPEAVVLVYAASALVVIFAFGASATTRRAAILALLLLALWDPSGRLLARGFADETRLEESFETAAGPDTAGFLHANDAAAFIAARSAERPARYAGYKPDLLPDPATFVQLSPGIGYRGARGKGEADLNLSRLLVFNWGSWFGISDVQGYNPFQIQRYVDYIDAANGHIQEYHERDLFRGSLRSPLLDLLNMRFLAIDADEASRAEADPDLATFVPVYADEHVQILENTEALSRAWLVHDARQVDSGEALALLVNGTVDPRKTALVEAPLPLMMQPAGSEAEWASYRHYEPDRIDVQVSAAAPALLMLSEIWDPGWSATVSGLPAPVLVADHVLRAVPVPAGEHLVVLRYEPPWLKLGLWVTFGTAVLLTASAFGLARRAHGPMPRDGRMPA